MIEVEECRGVSQFAEESCNAWPSVGRAKLDQRILLEFEVRWQSIARDAFDKLRIVMAKCLLGIESENVPFSCRQAYESTFERCRQLVVTQLECCRREIKSADEFDSCIIRKPVVQGQVAVGLDGRLGHCDFLRNEGLCLSGVLLDRLILVWFPSELIPDQQDGSQGDGRISNVERGPIVAGDMPLDKVNDSAETDAVDDVAERATEDEREGKANTELAGVLAQQHDDPARNTQRQRGEKPALPASGVGQKAEGGTRIKGQHPVEKGCHIN